MVGGLEEGVAGRQTESKALVVIAAEADGPGIGRIRMRVVEDASTASLHPFVQDCVAPGSLLHTDGWQGYSGLDQKGYQREVTVLRGRRKEASTLMPRDGAVEGMNNKIKSISLPSKLDKSCLAHGPESLFFLIGESCMQVRFT